MQQALDEMLSKFNGVAIVVAHRLTTICNCDKIVVMGDNGTKVEEGTHEELLRVPKQVDKEGNAVVGPGLYHTLWDTQQVTGEGSDKAEALREKMEEQQAEMQVQQQRVEEQQQEIEALRRELNTLTQTQQLKPKPKDLEEENSAATVINIK